MEEQIYITMAKILNGEASAAERQEFDAWLSADPQNKQTFNELKGVWADTDVLLQTPKFDHEAAWTKVAPKLNTNEETLPEKGRVIQFPAWRKYMLAGAAALVIGFFALWNMFQGNNNIVVFAAKENMELTLPDNSHITLKQGSKLTYPKRFDEEERHVSLNGEAFFNVTRNEKQPFTIDAGAATVKVLGTSFDVHSGNEVAVVVATGKVEVRSNTTENVAVILTPGEKGIVNAQKAIKQYERSDNYLYWKTGELLFSDKPFAEVVKDLNSYTGEKIRLSEKADEDLKNQLINISFRKESTEDILTQLSLITKTKWTKKGDEYILSPKK